MTQTAKPHLVSAHYACSTYSPLTRQSIEHLLPVVYHISIPIFECLIVVHLSLYRYCCSRLLCDLIVGLILRLDPSPVPKSVDNSTANRSLFVCFNKFVVVSPSVRYMLVWVVSSTLALLRQSLTSPYKLLDLANTNYYTS